MAENRRVSRIPMAPPPSAMKSSGYNEQQSLRMSIAPGARLGASTMRQSLAGGPPPLRLVPPGSVQRPSVFHAPTNPLGQSAAGSQTPLGSSTARRGSMMPPRSVPLQTAPSGFAKDPRELRQKPAQYAMWDTVLQWLRQTGFDTQGLKLTSITAQSFRAIFEHLILTILDDYAFTPVQDSRERGAKMDKEKGKWEQEFLTVLAFLGYPFISTVDQKWLATPSAPYSWPSLLAALHWTTELAKGCIAGEDGGHPALQDASRVPEVFDEDEEDYPVALLHEFLMNSYAVFLTEGLETFPDQEQALRERYEAKNVAAHRELEENTKALRENQDKRAELLKSKPDLERLEATYQSSAADVQKYVDYLKHMERRHTKAIAQAKAGAAELQRREEELAGLRAKLASLHEVVKEQNLSADEVIRMNTEHEALSRNARELGGKAQDGRNAVSALEVAVANRASKADEAVETYNDKLLALQLAATGPGGAALTLELNTASSVPEEILVGPDVRKDIKPALNRAAEQRRLQKAQIESEKLKVDHIVHILTTDCDNEQEAVDLVVRETTQLTDQEAAIKEGMEDVREVNDREVERSERDIAQAKHAAKTSGMGAKARLQALQFAQQEQVEKTERLLDQTYKEIVKHTQSILDSKSETMAAFDRLHKLALST